MKLIKTLSLILALILIFALASCGKTGTDTTTAEQSAETATEERTTEPEVQREGKTVEGRSEFLNIDYTVYVPSNYDGETALPMLMALHGGYQGTYGLAGENRNFFADYTGLNGYAEKYGFIVVYPRQNVENHFQKIDYWNWYFFTHRDEFETEALYNIYQEVCEDYKIDGENVYICGYSAGAAMAEIMTVCYTDVFSGCCSVAGISYAAIDYAMDAANVMVLGPTKTADVIANEIKDGMNPEPKASKLLVVSGTADSVVNPVNSQIMSEAWAKAMTASFDFIDASVESETAEGINGVSYTKTVYAKDANNGEQLCVYYSVDGMDHVWPGSVPGHIMDLMDGGQGDISYQGGIDVNEEMCRFFGLNK